MNEAQSVSELIKAVMEKGRDGIESDMRQFDLDEVDAEDRRYDIIQEWLTPIGMKAGKII